MSILIVYAVERNGVTKQNLYMGCWLDYDINLMHYLVRRASNGEVVRTIPHSGMLHQSVINTTDET